MHGGLEDLTGDSPRHSTVIPAHRTVSQFETTDGLEGENIQTSGENSAQEEARQVGPER